jgi:hypothetical protein
MIIDTTNRNQKSGRPSEAPTTNVYGGIYFKIPPRSMGLCE